VTLGLVSLQGAGQEPKHAPEPVREGFALGDPNTGVVLGDPKAGVVLGEPPAPASTVVEGPLVVTDRLEVREGGRVTPPPASIGGGSGVFSGLATPFIYDKAVVAVHVRALITVFEEVDQYDSRLQHNRPPPALWINDAEYLRDIIELVRELRRFNDLLEAENSKTNTESIAKSGSLIGKMAEKACLAAAAVIGGSLGAVVVASVYSVISYTDAGAEVLQRLPLIGKGK
jgi:hypothetical protein